MEWADEKERGVPKKPQSTLGREGGRQEAHLPLSPSSCAESLDETHPCNRQKRLHVWMTRAFSDERAVYQSRVVFLSTTICSTIDSGSPPEPSTISVLFLRGGQQCHVIHCRDRVRECSISTLRHPPSQQAGERAAARRCPLEDVQADYICVSVIKLPVSTFELTFVATILGRSMTYDVLRKRFPSNGYHVAQYLSSGRAPCRVHLLAADACSLPF